MIVANERANKGLEVFDNNGAQGFEMRNETLQMCAGEDGELWNATRNLNLTDADGNLVLSISWSEGGLCGTLHDNDFMVEIEEEF
tara:strand:- start:200 stop:454 length:255 start_codon:yes stop_codon:yes gene_type:complete